MPGKTLAVLAAVAALTTGLAANALASTNRVVSVRDDSFSRSSMTIPRTDTITWKWRGTDNRHNVKSGSNNPVAFKSKTRSGNYSYAHKFNKTGTYKIICTIHPSTMRLTVKVTRG
ncbi:MAG: cupredoxin domain-containing protein [Solirubrobacterales bacterium]